MWCLSFFFLLFLFSPNLSGRKLDVYHTSTHDMKFKMHAARGSLKIQDAKIMQKIAMGAPSHNFVGLYLRNEGMYRQSGIMLNDNISSICLHNMLNFGRLTAEICWRVWGTPSKFQRVSRLGLVTAPTSLNGRQPNFARCLAVSCAGILCIHFWGPLPPNGILPGAKFTLRPNLAFSYIGSVTARRSSTVRQPNFVALSRGRSLIAVARPSVVCLSVVCNARAPYSGGCNFRQFFTAFCTLAIL